MRTECCDRTYWPAVFTFYGIACAVSWPFFWWLNMHPESWTNSTVPAIARWMGLMWGPGIAAVICFIVFRNKHRRTITFRGNSTIRSVCFYLVPMALLWFTHPSAARTSLGLVNHPEKAAGSSGPLLYGAFTFMIFVYALGEELGWRGFLQDALRSLEFFPRFATIGILWEFWHFTNRTTHRSAEVLAITVAISYPTSILISFIIGVAVERSRSLCVAVTLHQWVDNLFHFAGAGTFVVFGVSVIFWLLLLWRWPAHEQPFIVDDFLNSPKADVS